MSVFSNLQPAEQEVELKKIKKKRNLYTLLTITCTVVASVISGLSEIIPGLGMIAYAISGVILIGSGYLGCCGAIAASVYKNTVLFVKQGVVKQGGFSGWVLINNLFGGLIIPIILERTLGRSYKFQSKVYDTQVDPLN